MRIVTLLENDTIKKDLKKAHGLSFYIETKKHKILFDLGPKDFFLKNAKRLNVNIKDVDIVVISHGHDDHAGGLLSFLKINKTATIYVNKKAFDEHIKIKNGIMFNIGVSFPKKYENRFVFVDQDMIIDNELTIFANVPYQKPIIGSSNLQIYRDGFYQDYMFRDEIYLVVFENYNKVLFSGCSHNGIGHIIDTLEQRAGILFSQIVGGFHLSHFDEFNVDQADFLDALSLRFKNRKDTEFFTCHCTGEKAYNYMKFHLKDKLVRLKTGDSIIF
jgi:7,8-dihydropterin-6-yl-methyl-4-(beta-D-ribofuranosyl)aminobenzene 5'-phosphate synthase